MRQSAAFRSWGQPAVLLGQPCDLQQMGLLLAPALPKAGTGRDGAQSAAQSEMLSLGWRPEPLGLPMPHSQWAPAHQC